MAEIHNGKSNMVLSDLRRWTWQVGEILFSYGVKLV